MPFKSQAQRRKFAHLMVEGKISPETFEEWSRETGGAKLPEHAPRRAKKAAKKTRAAKRPGRKKTAAKKSASKKTPAKRSARKKTGARKRTG